MGNKYPVVSIIIPLYVITSRFFNDLNKFDKLDYPRFEILIVCDKKIKIPKLKKAKIKFILTKHRKTGPAEKRDLALKYATGAICAFIDDDAYPDPKWLKNAVINFQKESVAAVGGPGLTPIEDKYWEQLTGLVYGSYFCGGAAQYRFAKGKKQYVEDYPAYNLLVRTDILKKVGGYGNYFYGGEDTFLCLKLIKKGYKILYNPSVVVYHYRRALFMPYLRQIANVGKHRGYFARKFPETSRKLFYFIPSCLAIGFILLLMLSIVNYLIAILFICMVVLSLIVGMLSVIKFTNLWNALIVSMAIILTHLVYGYSFIIGMSLKKLER